MALVIERPKASFDLKQIKRGYLLWGKHCTWDEGKAGFVTSATEEQLIVQYHPGISNVTNHFMLPVSEVADGQWEIRWSADMSEVFEYGVEDNMESGKNQEEEKHEMEGCEAEDEPRETNT